MPSGYHTQVNKVAVGGGSTDVAVVVGGYGEVQWRRPVLELFKECGVKALTWLSLEW